MLQHDQRFCDVCAEPIPRGTPYRCGYTSPQAVASWFDDARFMPTFTREPDGTVRIDVCQRCAAESTTIQECSEPAMDGLQ